jgi:hypothetical protein
MKNAEVFDASASYQVFAGRIIAKKKFVFVKGGS